MNNFDKSKIGLLDNACHSLKRGHEMFNQGKRKQDPLALKESIIWIHHGIELSLKQLLVQSNEYLVFENIDEAVRKLAHLRKQSDMNNANVLDLFDLEQGAYTVGFRKLVNRAAIMLNIRELSPNHDLREKIDNLTIYRNKIVHFTVDVKFEQVVSLLGTLMEPFLVLLEKHIVDRDFVEKCIPLIRASAESVYAVYKLQHLEAEKRVKKLLSNFNDTEVSGEYFRVPTTIKLPKFSSIIEENMAKDVGFDFLAKSDAEPWRIEIKIGALNSSQIKHFQYKSREYVANGKVWLIVFGNIKTHSYTNRILRDSPILISSQEDIIKLEKILNIN